MATGSFPGIKRLGRGVDHPPHLEPELKKEYISIPPLCLRGLFWGELHFKLALFSGLAWFRIKTAAVE
jgi:hypothetical protein